MRLRASIAVLCLAVVLLTAVTPCVVIVACVAFAFEPAANVVAYVAPAACDEQPLALLAVARFRAPPAAALA